jgi:hypothetical protein
MLKSQLALAISERQKPGFDQAYNPLRAEWNVANFTPPSHKLNPKMKTKSPKTVPSLPTAKRRFYATRAVAEELKYAPLHAATLPLILARALDGVKAEVDKAVTVTVNANGIVSVLATSSAPATFFTNYLQLLSNTLNEHLPIEKNNYNVFNLAPTTSDFVIHNVPTHVLP